MPVQPIRPIVRERPGSTNCIRRSGEKIFRFFWFRGLTFESAILNSVFRKKILPEFQKTLTHKGGTP